MSRPFAEEVDHLRPVLIGIRWDGNLARRNRKQIMILMKINCQRDTQWSAKSGDISSLIQQISFKHLVSYARLRLTFFVSPTITVNSFDENDKVFAFGVPCKQTASKNICERMKFQRNSKILIA